MIYSSAYVILPRLYARAYLSTLNVTPEGKRVQETNIAHPTLRERFRSNAFSVSLIKAGKCTA